MSKVKVDDIPSEILKNPWKIMMYSYKNTEIFYNNTSNEDLITIIKTSSEDCEIKKAYSDLFVNNMGMILEITKRVVGSLACSYLRPEDLIQETYGLMCEYVRRFDPKKGGKFNTYFFKYLEKELRNIVNAKRRLYEVGQSTAQKFYRAHSYVNKFMEEGYEYSESIDLSCKKMKVQRGTFIGYLEGYTTQTYSYEAYENYIRERDEAC